MRRHARPEEIHVLSGEGARGERPGVDHYELARSRKDRVDRHQQEHGVDTVITDQRRKRARDAGDRHVERLSAHCKVALGDRVTPLIVVRDDAERPSPLRLTDRAPVEAVDAWSASARIDRHDHAARPVGRRGHRRGAYELVRDRERGAWRNHLARKWRRVDAVVVDRQRIGERGALPFAASDLERRRSG